MTIPMAVKRLYSPVLSGNVVTEEQVKRYIDIEQRALDKLKIAPPENSFLNGFANDAILMIRSYFSDAKHFLEKGNLTDAFAALNYSYGWIDSLVRLGILDGGNDHTLFTLYK